MLSEKGKQQAEELAKSGIFDSVDIVISSNEEKSYQTAKPIAVKYDKEIMRIEELNELDRGASGFLEKDEYDRTVEFALNNLTKSRHRWETAEHALKRFTEAIESIDSEHEGKKILIVTHGCVMNLYFAKLLSKLDVIYERWIKTSFCSWAIIKNGKVVKDIVE